MRYDILLLMSLCMDMHAFMIQRVILATDTHEDYIEFWPIVAKAWKDVMGITPTLALIAKEGIEIDASLGEVIRFDPIEGIPTSFQAQVVRLLLPTLFPDDICIVSDIDMVPLKKEYFIDTVKPYSRDAFVVFRDNAYRAQECKFPMCYIAAKGQTFKEVFNIDQNGSIEQKMREWYALNLGWNTDELVLYESLKNWDGWKARGVKLGHGVGNRIDRSCWMYDPQFLDQGYYIDAHCPRPYSAHKKTIDDLVKRARSKQKKRWLENADYGTHMAPLLTVVSNTSGPILEMGSGDFSTPLLHAVCSAKKRLLFTTDTDRSWLNNFVDLENDWHTFKYVPVYDDDWQLNPHPELWDEVGANTHWSVVLIDHRPGERRIQDVVRLRNNADVFVVHDSQQPSYGYDAVLNTFKYKYVYERYTTQTTIVSDSIDIATFFKD